jgi:hypothetical protein
MSAASLSNVFPKAECVTDVRGRLAGAGIGGSSGSRALFVFDLYLAKGPIDSVET